MYRRGDNGEDLCADVPTHDPLATGEPLRVRRLYVAGPMSGLPECNYQAFNRAAEALREAGYEVVNPVDVGERSGYRELLKDDLIAMLSCQGVATLRGWEHSTGARNEVMVAGVVALHVKTVGYWLAVAPPESPS